MRFRTWITGFLATAVAILVAIANRHDVVLSLDPFSQDAPALAFSIPLYLALFALFILGVLVGGSSAWLGQGRWRKQARKEKRRSVNLERDLATQAKPVEEATKKEALPPPDETS